MHDLHVYEIDGGPSGTWCEVYRGSEYLGAAKMHTLVDWELANA